MRAALYRRPGPPADVLQVVDIERPEPGPGQVRVRVVASGINPTDWKTVAGLTDRTPDEFQIPHHDGAGVVDALGDGVIGPVVGQRVWTHLAAFGNRYGTAAEYAILPAERIAPLPDHASYALGASLGVPALTAAHCLGGDPDALMGRTVLVAGGAGAVGHFAIQLAKHAGATVVSTVSSPAKAELARHAGADTVIDYTKEDVAAQVLATTGPVDRVVEVAFGTNLDLDLRVLAQPGTIATYAAQGDVAVPAGRLMAANTTLVFALLYGLTDGQLAAAGRWTTEALEARSLTELPVLRYDLDQIVQAHERAAEGPVGKVIVDVADH